MWQDWVFVVGGFIFAVALLPTVLDPKARVPFKTSASTAAVLTAYVFTQWSLHLHWGAASGTLTASAWWFIAWKRRTPREPRMIFSRVRVPAQNWTHDGPLGAQAIHYEFVEGCTVCETDGPEPSPTYRGRRFK